MYTKFYPYKEKFYKITYLTDEEFWKTINNRPIKDKYSWLRRRLVRGFTIRFDGGGYVIYIKDSAKIGRDKLILHEIGHVLNKKHKWYLPFIMHPTWVFRWFKVML